MVCRGCVRWRGQFAEYTPEERLIMRDLPVPEQAFVHTLKAFTDGEIGASDRTAPLADTSSAVGSMPNIQIRHTEGPTVYTDPEDIEFGGVCRKGKQGSNRKRPVYVVTWTWRQSRVHKTKKRCEQRLKVWKRWYERQGWKVYRLGSGYWAISPAGEKHAISLHEYDKETKERLN
jgi:hypothetical protein